ncbi:MAG TPA: VWA domain-containing protein, partial [Polyangiaceae bacterium]
DCNRANYQIPAVPFALLPAAANAFGIALAQTMPNGNTPTTPALQGAIDFARSQIMANPSRDVAVVLTSDGVPNGCNSTVATAAAAAMAGVAGTPSIKTYVIGVGPSLANLNQIAAAGGTGQAFLIDTNNTAAAVATQFTAALGKIAAPITCNYTIPMVAGKPLDFSAVNIQTRVGANGDPQLVGKVTDAAGCGTGDGWYYDNNAMPTKITLCPTTCTPLMNTMGSHLQILIGCATQMGHIN